MHSFSPRFLFSHHFLAFFFPGFSRGFPPAAALRIKYVTSYLRIPLSVGPLPRGTLTPTSECIAQEFHPCTRTKGCGLRSAPVGAKRTSTGRSAPLDSAFPRPKGAKGAFPNHSHKILCFRFSDRVISFCPFCPFCSLRIMPYQMVLRRPPRAPQIHFHAQPSRDSR